MLNKIHNRYKYFFLLYDIFFLLITIFLAPAIRFKGLEMQIDYVSFRELKLYIIIFIYILIFYIYDLYNAKYYKTRWKFILNYTYAFMFIAVFIAAFAYMFSDLSYGRGMYGRGIYGMQLVFSYIILALGRISIINYINKKVAKRRILVIGNSIGGKVIAEELLNDPYCEFLGYLGNQSKESDFKYLGKLNTIDNKIRELNPDAVVIADRKIVKDSIEQSILNAKMKGLYIYDMPSMIEILREKIPVHHIDDYWVIFNSFIGLHINQYNLRFKRLIDVIVSIIGIIISFPVLLISSLFIKLESKGPAFYTQYRVGINETQFKVIKLRTMCNDAEEKSGAIWAGKDDPRVTGCGKILRKFRIDEFPQFLNVLKGDMTVVGPRPERPEFVEMLKKELPYYSLRHLIKPGVTGWAQIHYPYASSVEDALYKLEYDLYYMRHLTLRLDVNVILRTIRLFGHGSR